jgi:hypothetical protein
MLTAVSKRETLGWLRKLVRRAIQEDDFDTSWLQLRNLRVIPEESALHFDEDEARRLTAAFASEGVDRLWGVAAENLGGIGDAWSLTTSQSDLLRFSEENGPFNFLLVDEALRVAIYCSSSSDSLLLAGSERFLRAYFGRLQRAVAEFWSFAQLHADEPIYPRLQRYLEHAKWVESLPG